MSYRRTVVSLVLISAFLTLSFALSFFLSAEKREDRRSFFSLLDPRSVDSISRIEIISQGSQERFFIEKQSSFWRVKRDGEFYPIKKSALNELIKLLSERSLYVTSSSTEKAHQALGLEEGKASRVAFYSSSAVPFLDLLIGDLAQDGKHVYIRRATERSSFLGDLRYERIAKAGSKAWLDLAFFSEDLIADSVQRVGVNTGSYSYTLTRKTSSSWAIEGKNTASVDSMKINAWIKSILSMEGDDLDGQKFDSRSPTVAEIILDMADGTIRRILISEPASSAGFQKVRVSGRQYSFLVASRRILRLIKQVEEFKSSLNK